MPIAATEGLTVRYGAAVAVRDLTLEIPSGCTGILGPNGAGKTTLIKTLLGFIRPSSGSAKVMDLDVATQELEIRARVGLMPESDCHIPGMNAVTFVAYAGELAGMPSRAALRRAHEVLEYCGLGEARYRNVETYSTGMKQRIKLAQALVHGPGILILDEPTNGLDPAGREEMLALVRDISHGKGLSVMVSSHLLPDIERTCDQVILMQQGRLAAQGAVEDLRKTDGRLYEVEVQIAVLAFEQALEWRSLEVVSQVGARYRLVAPAEMADVARAVFEAAREAGAQVRGIMPARRSLEEVFMEAVD
ncbi:MAG: ABC transporter ATP-binding protein [Armatimonadetes bacterium]|nr:ABC transporter ATP-binding protein [Armatimonadota bacterium]